MKKVVYIVVLLVLFSSITNSYADKNNNKNKSLPPGLEKRADQGKPLPPGWQKKLHKGDRLSDDIYARGSIVVPIGSDGMLSIEVEGTIIKLHEKTREIIDILL